MYEDLVKSLRLCTSDKRGYGCAKECAYGKKHPLNWWRMDYLLKEAADAIEELSKALDAVNDAHNEGYDVGYWAGRRDYEPKWIPVTERFPDECGKYLTAYSDGYVTENEWCFIGLTAVGWSYDRDAVTHWMPLPEPPKEDEVRV